MEKRLTVECVDYAHDGRGVARVQNYPIFIENFLVGETANIVITKEVNKKYYLGRIEELLTVSPARVKPICENYKHCGGCQLMHMNYAEQLHFKRERVQEVLKRIGGVSIHVEPVIGMEDPYKYRNKVQVPFGFSHRGLIAGFYKKGTHQIIDMERCYIEDEEADKIIVSCKKIFKQLDIQPYDHTKHRGIVRYVLVRKSNMTQQLMVVLITRTPFLPKKEAIVDELIRRHPFIATIIQNINPERTNVILGNQERILYGEGYIEDEIGGLEFKISSQSFYQVNPLQTEVLYEKALEFAQLKPTDVVLDAYCGVGTIGLLAAKQAKYVLGVEVVAAAIADAEENAKRNQIHNAEFLCEDATTFMRHTDTAFDVVFVDPPRQGCTPDFCQALLKMQPKRIVYISCEPSSLARDLVLLQEKYEVIKVQPVDMFPQTYHVESITLLSLKTI